MSETQQRVTHAEILIIGAGPVGLVSALALRSSGRSVTLLEAGAEDRLRPGSRAIYVHRDSLKLIEQVQPGLGREIAAQGLVWSTKRTLWRGRTVFVQHYPTPAPDVLPPFTSLPQQEIERNLLRACKDAGVTCSWNSEVNGVTTTADSVTVTTASGDTWTADYLIGADGARSAVRHALDIPLEGDRSANTYIVLDVAEDPQNPLPNERTFHYHHPAVGGRNVLFVPFVGGWRIDLQCRESDNPDDFSTSEGVNRWLAQVMPERYTDRITWISSYQFLQVLARTFTDQRQRALLVGEAAHLFAPFGARGMNSGIADAVAAAKAIDSALKASSQAEAETAIASFTESRQAAAEYNRAAAGKALAHTQTSNPLALAKREVAALLAPYWKRAGAWLDSGPYGPRTGRTGQTAGRY